MEYRHALKQQKQKILEQSVAWFKKNEQRDKALPVHHCDKIKCEKKK